MTTVFPAVVTATHMLLVDDGWVDAVRVWCDMGPEPAPDGAVGERGWRFGNGVSLLRWLDAERTGGAT